MKVIKKENKWELQFLFDSLEEILNDWGQIIIPKMLSVNKTGDKYIKNWDESFLTIQEIKEWKDLLYNPDSLFISLIVWK